MRVVVLLTVCVAAAAAQTHSLSGLLDAYASGRFDILNAHTVPERLDELRGRLPRDAERWINAAPSAGQRRRQVVAATVALELARRYLDVNWDSARGLIVWGSELLRKGGSPDNAERLWHLAALSLMQAAVDYQLQSEESRKAWIRFPDEPRFMLADAVAMESTTFPDWPREEPWPDDEQALRNAARMVDARTRTTPPTVREQAIEFRRRERMHMTITRLEDLSNLLDLRGEALLRLGALHLRLRRPELAREQFEAVLALDEEPFIVYLAHYFTGQALEQEGNAADAVAAYRAALAAWPRAQAASVALASLLFLADERAEAHAIIESALTEPVAEDPVRIYCLGDLRLWPQRIDDLREAVQ